MKPEDFQDTQTLEVHLGVILNNKRKAKELKEKLGEANAAVSIAESELISAMKEQGLKSFKPSATGKNVSIGLNFYANVAKKNEEELFEWLRENDMGSLIKEEVNNSTFKKALKEEVIGTDVVLKLVAEFQSDDELVDFTKFVKKYKEDLPDWIIFAFKEKINGATV